MRQSFVTAATDQLNELQRRLAELTTIQRVARAINSTLDLDAIFQTVVVHINTAFNYQMVSIYLREGNGLRLQAYLGYDDPASHGYRHRRHAQNEALYGPAGSWYVYLS